ncbi:hypothetical protein HQ865_20930 [Mucilaginibacter mali]|uniref:Uncharacterized protein n=1 Tax=Mucilaginibacter mali TaxID=2740462 RepID=A0A7D4QEL5_9SPHI|nr:hypothetical protein [Mucilaginibacter mali]QKJ32124.1 hypothetical protein HQ865_20930 [Mucilaginibacter mali]
MDFLNNLFKGKQKEKKRFPPIPSWRPDTPVNHDEIMDRAKYYTDEKVQLGVFENGTVALFPPPQVNIEEETKATLNKIYYSHPDFNPMTMDDGNYLIQYRHPAFTIVFKKELDDYWDYIEENHLRGVCTDEVLMNSQGKPNVFDRISKICLYGRAKMFMDAQDPKIVRVFDPFAK